MRNSAKFSASSREVFQNAKASKRTLSESKMARRFRAGLLAASVMGGLGFAIACGSDDSATVPTENTVQGFRGIILSETGEQGVFDVRTSSASVGALSFKGVAPITLSGEVSLGGGIRAQVTGTYNPTTGAVGISGTATVGGIPVSINATFSGGRLTGTATVAGVTRSLSGFGIGVEPVELFCGQTQGRVGSIGIAASGNLAAGVLSVTGEALKVFGGAKNGATLSLAYSPDGTVGGTVGSGTITGGTFSDSAGPGTFTASTSACPPLGSIFVDAGPGSDATVVDGSTGNDASVPTDATVADTSVPTDGGPAPFFTIAGTNVGDLVASTDYLAVNSDNNVEYIKKDGTGRSTVTGACTNGCVSTIAVGSTFYVLDGVGNLKSFTPPSTTISATITTLSGNNTAAASDGTNIYFIRTSAAGLLRLPPSNVGGALSISGGFDIRGLDVGGGQIFFTRQSTNGVMQRMASDFSAGPVDLAVKADVAPDDLPGGLATDGTETYFLTQHIGVNGQQRLWVQSGSGAVALVATIPTIGILGQKPQLDATRVYLSRLNGTTFNGEVISYARSDRGATTPVVLQAFPAQGVASIIGDSSVIYASLSGSGNGRQVVKLPKP